MFFFVAGVSDAVAASWDRWLMLHLWWVFLCSAFMCRQRRRVVLAAVVWSIVDLWHGKQNDSTVYFFHWYLFIGHLYFFFLKAIAFFFGGQAGLEAEKRALIGILPYERHIVSVLLATVCNVKIETHVTVGCYCGCRSSRVIYLFLYSLKIWTCSVVVVAVKVQPVGFYLAINWPLLLLLLQATLRRITTRGR